MPLSNYLVSYGQRGDFAQFRPGSAIPLTRGDRVVVRTDRGLEMGTVLRECEERLVEMLPTQTIGELLRKATIEDEGEHVNHQVQGQALLCEVERAQTSLPCLDVEVLLDGQTAVLHALGADPVEVGPTLTELSQQMGFRFLFEDVGAPVEVEVPAPTCGKEGCGSGDCGSCGSGGCDTCGSKSTDLQAYFAEMRKKMEAADRVSLL